MTDEEVLPPREGTVYGRRTQGPLNDVYADYMHVTCPDCGAEPDAYCINEVTKLPRKIPCPNRIRAVDHG